MLRTCNYCQSLFHPHKKVPSQKFCSKNKCQKARWRQWQKQKMQNDVDYKKNQQEAQKEWCKKNPDYWRSYRKNHPGYVERDEVFQKMNVMSSPDTY